jgi:DNA-binding IclR family transcriptional regulator
MCIASSVITKGGTTCAAISLVAPASRIDGRLPEQIEILRATAGALAAELGPFATERRNTSDPQPR